MPPRRDARLTVLRLGLVCGILGAVGSVLAELSVHAWAGFCVYDPAMNRRAR
jgi:hypothetical protein